MPVYNERTTIEEIIRRVLAVPLRIELIVVDDGSRTGPGRFWIGFKGARLHAAAAGECRKGGRAAEGFAAVTGDIAVIQDADLEYSPEEFPQLIDLIVPGEGGRRVWLTVPRPSPRVHVRALRGQQAPHAGHEHPVQHDAHRHGNLLQGHADRGAAIDDAEVERLRDRAEITAKIFKRGYRVYEVPITYAGRGYTEGKKITWAAGFVALWVLFKYRFTE